MSSFNLILFHRARCLYIYEKKKTGFLFQFQSISSFVFFFNYYLIIIKLKMHMIIKNVEIVNDIHWKIDELNKLAR